MNSSRKFNVFSPGVWTFCVCLIAPGQTLFADPGLAERPENLTCEAPARPVSGSAEVAVESVLPSLSFGELVNVEEAPGDADLLYIFLRLGRIVRARMDVTDPVAETVLDISSLVVNEAGTNDQAGGMDFVFHPNFESNGEIYVTYGIPGDRPISVLARFTSTDGGASFPLISQEILIQVENRSQFHSIGDLVFGQDGYLYISHGDGGKKPSVQDTTTIFGKVWRIDVDSGTPYAIPENNPFGDETFAYGLRNPWRITQDRETGEFWAGDVGNSEVEEVNRLVSGGNYGWPILEGDMCFQADTCDGTGMIAPYYSYPHTSACASITGGPVYRGTEIPALIGKYLFSDWCTGDISALDPANPPGSPAELLLASGLSVTDFSESTTGEVYVIGAGGSKIWRLVNAGDPDPEAGDFPTLLSETGCFNPSDPREVTDGVIPFDINTPLWSDGSGKRRWFAIPDDTTIDLATDGDFLFPTGTVLIKEFSFEGTPHETRLFVRHEDGGWAGYSYEWNEALTDAELVAGSKTKTLDVGLEWLYPSQTDCTSCHTSAANRALGPEIAQLNRPFVYPSTGIESNQLETLDAIGMFSTALPALPGDLDALSPIGSDDADDLKARSYLHSNCSGCHRIGGPTQAQMDFRYHIPFENMRLCNEVPELGDLGITGGRILVPLDPDSSIFVQRMLATDGNRMPPIATNIVHTEATDIMVAWVNSITECPDIGGGTETGGATLDALQDTFINQAVVAANYGTSPRVRVTSNKAGLLHFDAELLQTLSGAPSAILELYVLDVNTAGTFSIHKVEQPWDEDVVTYGTMPAYSAVSWANFDVVAADERETISVDITALVQSWLADAAGNHGLAIRTAGSAYVDFGTKDRVPDSRAHIVVAPDDGSGPPDNTMPVVTITAPLDGLSVPVGTGITFSASAIDGQDGDISAQIAWTAGAIDLGTGASVSYSALPVGVHTVAASVTDTGSLVGVDEVTVTVTGSGGSGGSESTLSAVEDTWLNASAPGANYSAQKKTMVNNSPNRFGLVRFDLGSLSGQAATNAVLRIYTSYLGAAGPVSLQTVAAPWGVSTVTHATRPALDATVVSTVGLTAADVKKYVTVDVTLLVQGWLSGAIPNHGLALTPAGSVNAKLGSIESGFPFELIVTTGPAGNQKPDVDAGADQVVESGTSASLLGVVTDDGMPDPPGAFTVEWTRTGGTGAGTVSFSSPTTLATEVSATADGEYELTLTADDDELTGSDTLILTVQANMQPTANAGVDQTVSLSGGATLAGGGTDDGLPNPPGLLTYMWTQTGGIGTASFADDTLATTTVSFDQTGTYELTLTVSDSLLSHQDVVEIIVDDSVVVSETTLSAVEDTWLNGSAPGINYAPQKKMLVNNSPNRLGLARFDLGSLSGHTATNAVLRVYTTYLGTPGPVNVQTVAAAWDVSNVTHGTQPALDATVVSTVGLTAGDVKKYVTVDVTLLVQGWLSGSIPNHGLALTPAGSVNAKLGSIESGFPLALVITSTSP